MRIFVALDIHDDIRQRIQRFIEGVGEFAPNARWLRAESLHVTLKFIGEKPEPAVEQIRIALHHAKGSQMELSFRGCGFFPTPKSARVFWIGVESGAELKQFAASVDTALAELGMPKEDHAFT